MFTLIACAEDGKPVSPIADMPESLLAACAQSAALYQNIGYQVPWVSYVATASGQAVGGAAFVGAPTAGIVEIAYFTLDVYQGRGYATQTARELVAIARRAMPNIQLKAFTLPEENPSTRILTRLGFTQIGDAYDEDAGNVWEWRST